MDNRSSGPLRIAIIEADTPIAPITAKYGSYGGVFTSLLHKAADRMDVPRDQLKLSGWDVVDIEREGTEEDCGGIHNWKRTKGYPELDTLDAILITGSKYNAFDDDPWVLRLVDFTKKALAHLHVRVVGICYGHQIVARALGAKVKKETWETSVCEVQQTAKGREIFGDTNILRIMQMHKDIVCGYPPDVEPLGSSPACEVQGMYLAKRLISVQGHPEFDEEMVRELLIKRHEQGIFDDAHFEDGMRRVSNEQDGVKIAEAVLKFLRD